MGDWGLYLLFLVPPLVVGLAVQAWLRRTFSKYSNLQLVSGLSGAQVARQILDRNGLGEVPVTHSPGGPLSDHYDSGHALQQAHGYGPLRLRSAMFPAVAFASSAWIWLLIIGALLNALNLVAIALVLYAVAVAFHLITLPVEFDASRRAGAQLRELGLVTAGESAGVDKVLTAAALTYVAGALAALSQLLYYALVFFGED